MKLQKKIVYVSLITLVLFISMYGCILINDKETKIFEFVENILVGIIGGMFVSLIIGFISYLDERRTKLEKYYIAYKDLFNHCALYDRNHNSKEVMEWYIRYEEFFQKLDDSWAEIDFLFDLNGSMKYLKAVRNYYFDFIALTLDYFDKMEENNEAYNNHLVNHINDVIFGKQNSIKKRNKLYYDMKLVVKEVHNIYIGKHDKKITFNKSMVTKDSFSLLEEEEEQVVKEIIKAVDIVNGTTVEVILPDKICHSLKNKEYIDVLDAGKEKKRINCRYILLYYFKLKSRFQ